MSTCVRRRAPSKCIATEPLPSKVKHLEGAKLSVASTMSGGWEMAPMCVRYRGATEATARAARASSPEAEGSRPRPQEVAAPSMVAPADHAAQSTPRSGASSTLSCVGTEDARAEGRSPSEAPGATCLVAAAARSVARVSSRRCMRASAAASEDCRIRSWRSNCRCRPSKRPWSWRSGAAPPPKGPSNLGVGMAMVRTMEGATGAAGSSSPRRETTARPRKGTMPSDAAHRMAN
mmetsp:Transcript_10968/g.38592  ORF Transcript_10968/g.38592 Transcript_10968/m.38592 type:complete len:234 (-) Transcript_10968:297-998(-)